MIAIEKGKYLMGDLIGDGRINERPVHLITINKNFAVGKFEITIIQHAFFVRSTDRKIEPGCFVYNGKKLNNVGHRNWSHPGYPQSNKHPSSCINWYDATDYIEWLSKFTGQRYRLLSEPEWEYITRANTKTKYSFGDLASDLCGYTNGADKSTSLKWKNYECNDGFSVMVAPVGHFKANPFGAHDMHGNLFEWIEDCWTEPNNLNIPMGGRAVLGQNCERRGLRDRSWLYPANYLRSSLRFNEQAHRQLSNIGFRVARELSED